MIWSAGILPAFYRMPEPLDILYEDNHLLVVNKPAGILSQGDATGDRCLLEICRDYIRQKFNKPGNVFLGLVHRLDRPVSGVILFARTSKAAARLSEQFRKRTTKKIYHALVEGRQPTEEGELEDWLTGDAHRLKSMVSSRHKPGARHARLRFHTLRSEAGRTLLEVELLTGYKHQIRAQLAARGCPVVGDFKYDHRRKPARPQRVMDGHAICLHARSLTLTHPTRREEVAFEAPVPEYFF